MTTPRRALAAAVVTAALLLTSCAGTPAGSGTGATTPTEAVTPVIAPVVQSADDLQGATVELVVGQVLDITTGDLAVDSYSGEVADPAVASFIEGRDDGGASFNPGVQAIAPGSTEVTLSNTDGGIEDVTFTVTVTEE